MAKKKKEKRNQLMGIAGASVLVDVSVAASPIATVTIVHSGDNVLSRGQRLGLKM